MGAIALCGIGARLGSWEPGRYGAELSRGRSQVTATLFVSVYRPWRVKRDSSNFGPAVPPPSLALWCICGGCGEQSLRAAASKQASKQQGKRVVC